jgi:hypothetical protein
MFYGHGALCMRPRGQALPAPEFPQTRAQGCFTSRNDGPGRRLGSSSGRPHLQRYFARILFNREERCENRNEFLLAQTARWSGRGLRSAERQIHSNDNHRRDADPFTLTNYYSQTHHPYYHNFVAEFLFEPRLHPNISAADKAALEAANILRIPLRRDSDGASVIKAIDANETFRDL